MPTSSKARVAAVDARSNDFGGDLSKPQPLARGQSSPTASVSSKASSVSPMKTSEPTGTPPQEGEEKRRGISVEEVVVERKPQGRVKNTIAPVSGQYRPRKMSSGGEDRSKLSPTNTAQAFPEGPPGTPPSERAPPPAPQHHRRPPGHSRARSHIDIPASVQAGQYTYGTPVPPRQPSYGSYYQYTYPGPYGYPSSPTAAVGMYPPQPLPPGAPPIPFQRERSGSAEYGHVRSASYDLAPPRTPERMPLLAQQQQPPPPSMGASLSERPRSGRRSKGARPSHRRAHSSSAAMPGYGALDGAFWNNPEQEPPRRKTSYDADSRFSPRAEVKKFLGVRDASPGRSYQSYSSVPPTGETHRGVTWSVGTPPPPARQRSPSLGGEAAYFAQHRHRPESSRKMHMRQQSAQIFMEDVKGVEQPLQCRNIFFLLLFVFHLIAIGYLGHWFGGEALKYHDPETKHGEVTVFYKNLILIGCISGAFAVAVSGLLLGAMALFSRHFIQIALIIVIMLSFVWGTIGIGLSPKTAVPITGIIALGLAVAYTFIVWDRIPFSAANLLTALTGIRAYPGTVVVAFCFQALALAWSIYYTIVVIGIYDAVEGDLIRLNTQKQAIFIYILLGISFYWTFQVFQGCVQAITAGVIGGWWHAPETRGLVARSCGKTLFYSMGSICLGSLFVGPVRLLRQLSAFFRPSSAEPSLLCLHECMNCIQTALSSCVDFIAAGVNSWSFTYIGLYHYGFLDAGHNATELFEKRGWTTIVSDDLISNVLFLTSLVIGGITGCFAHVIGQFEGLAVTPAGDDPGLASFAVGLVIGWVLASVACATITSSVNAVLVCFASSPVDFEENHPDLSHEMRSAWREVWPGALDVMDISHAIAASMRVHEDPTSLL